jgi:hypothetical protein
VQPSGGVDENGVRLPLLTRLDGIEGDPGRILTRPVLDHLRPRPLPPDLQLLDGRGAKRIGGRKDDGPTAASVLGGQLSYRGRLSYPVHPDEHHDPRPGGMARREAPHPFVARKHPDDLVLQAGREIRRMALPHREAPYRVQQTPRRGHPHVGGDQNLLHGREHLIVPTRSG